MEMFISTVMQYVVLIFPWLILGIILSFLVEKSVHPHSLKKLSGRVSISKLIISQILGMISPLSIMSFLPVASELSNKGVNPGLLLSFFIAERAYDMQSLFITSGLFGVKFALLNALVIFVSLLASALSIRGDHVRFRTVKKSATNHFWLRQGKLIGIVCIGICIGAVIRTLVPQNLMIALSGGRISGFVSALLLGFAIYLGPIAGNYPVAKAFSELGMSGAGVFAFLTVSPICNFVVMMLFVTSVGFDKALKPILVYIVTATVLSFVVSMRI